MNVSLILRSIKYYFLRFNFCWLNLRLFLWWLWVCSCPMFLCGLCVLIQASLLALVVRVFVMKLVLQCDYNKLNWKQSWLLTPPPPGLSPTHNPQSWQGHRKAWEPIKFMMIKRFHAVPSTSGKEESLLSEAVAMATSLLVLSQLCKHWA